MDIRLDNPTINDSCKQEANLVDLEEALQTGFPLQCTNNVVRIVRWPT